MAQISIHRALTLIKNAEEDINSKLSTGLFVGTVVGLAKQPLDRAYKNAEELARTIQSDTDTIESKLTLISKLKVAIQQKNLEVKIDFLGESVSITELLAIKSTMHLRSSYVQRLAQQISAAQHAVENNRQSILKSVEKLDVGSGSYLSTLESLQSLQSVHIVTSNSKVSPAERLEQLRNELRFFTSEIDILLSETNITTIIEVDM